MTDYTPRNLKNTAALRLATASYDPRKLTLLHSGIALGAGFLVSLLSFALNLMIEGTGGLSDLGTRTMLGTVRTCLELAVNLLLPFWTVGFVHCAIRLARQDPAQPHNLLEGLRRWGVVLRLSLARILLYVAVAYLTVQAATIVVMFTPFAGGIIKTMEAMMQDPAYLEGAALSQELLTDSLQGMAPVYAIWAVLFLAVALPLSYRFRIADYRILDDDRPGALRAMAQSNRMTRGYKWQLCKLDLSFWWYYTLQVLLSLVAYADVLLPLIGVTVPLHEDLVYFVCYALYVGLALLLRCRFLAHVETTYAVFYDTRLTAGRPPAPIAPQEPPRNLPWQY